MNTKAWLHVASVVLLLAGCASGDEWTTWKAHPTHFASGEHMSFSVRNPDSGTGKATRRDVALARDEGWWGKPVTVSQETIIER